MARQEPTHAAPGRARVTRLPVARLKARALGMLCSLFEPAPTRGPVYDDVWAGPARRAPRSLNAAFPDRGPLTTFGADVSEHVCGTDCDPDRPSCLPYFSGAYTSSQGVSETC